MQLHDMLIVLNKDEDTLSIVDTHAQEVVKTVATSHNPHEIVVSACGKKSYIACSLGNVVDVLDHTSLEIVKHITHPRFDFPHGLGLSGSGHVYLASTYSGVVFEIDPITDDVISHFATHQKHSHMIAFHPDGRRYYVPNIGGNSVTYISDCTLVKADEDAHELEHIPVGRGPEGVAVHPDGKTVYIANQDDDDLWILDTQTHQQLYRRRLGRCPIRVVFSPDGKYALIPNRESGDLSILSTQYALNGTTKPWEIKRIPIGCWPGGTVFSPDGLWAYVANNKTNDLSVIDMTTLKEVKRIDVGIHPDGIAYMQASPRQTEL